jgi:hypothetical protein
MYRRVGGLTLAAAVSLTPVGDLSAQAQSAAGTGPESGAVASITVSDLQAKIGSLAHDSMRGRDTPSPELVKTAEYVADIFEAAGLKPGLGDSYIQWFPLSMVGPGPDDSQRLTITGPSGSLTLSLGEEFAPIPVAEAASGSGPLLRIGSLDELGDATGRVIALAVSERNIRSVFSGFRYATRTSGAAGALLVVETDEYYERLRSFFGGSRMSLGEFEGLTSPIMLVPASALPSALASAIAGDAAWPDGWAAELESAAEVREESAMNTIGWIEGSDPELRREYVMFTAHMDHVGVGSAIDGDSIYNGADDDASGTAVVMELAEAFAKMRPAPRRSMVFMTVSGEEKGLLGSQWYSEHPIFPLEQTVANLNMDMVGRNWQDTIAAIGKDESSLGPLVERVAAEHPELDMVVIDDQWPNENFYFRSDHYNFARKGVPILFFFNGTHADYHRPSDQPEKIEYDKTARLGKLLYYLGLQIANADGRPEWDPEAYERVVETDE